MVPAQLATPSSGALISRIWSDSVRIGVSATSAPIRRLAPPPDAMSAADASSPMFARPSPREVLAHLLEPQLCIEDTKLVLGIRGNGRNGVALGP